MYAVIEDGGKQYKVSQGDHLLIEKRDLAEGQAELTFDKVLLLGEGEQARVGTPWLQGAKVVAKVVEAVRTKKVIGIKFARRKGYKKKFGHRQPLLRVQISSILG